MNLRNPDTSRLLLIGLAALIFLLAALALFLLHPPAALPEGVIAASTTTLPSNENLVTPGTSPQIGEFPDTRTPRTSYTPFATRLTLEASATQPLPSPTVYAASPTPTPTGAYTPLPTASPTVTPTLGAGTPSPTPPIIATPIPSATATLAAGEYALTGQVLLNGTPLAGLTLSFVDDQPARNAVTNAEGRYWFTTYALGADFTILFEQSANPQLPASNQRASIAILQGVIPSGSQVISLPNMELSLVIEGQTFELLTPANEAAYSAAVITAANQIQFSWSTYNQADLYYVELEDNDTDEIVWSSDDTTDTYVMFDGTLDNSTHITQGIYTWMAAASRPLTSYRLTVYAQPRSLVMNP